MKEKIFEVCIGAFIVVTWLAGIVAAPTAGAKVASIIPLVAWYFLIELIMRKLGLVP